MNWFKAASHSDRSGDILVSFDARWFEPIKNGEVNVIYRRRIPTSFSPKRLFVYIKTPMKCLIGWYEIEKIEKVSAEEAKKYMKDASIAESDLREYFEGYLEVGIYVVGDFYRLNNSMTLEELNNRTGFTPPQSFVALSHRATEFLSTSMGK